MRTSLIVIWLLYLSGYVWTFLTSTNALLTTIPIGGLLGIASFIFAVKAPSLRTWYIITGLAGVIPFLFFAFYIWALGSGWKN
jgi:uncharacterized membrane protein YuzA (DUF378 family)